MLLNNDKSELLTTHTYKAYLPDSRPWFASGGAEGKGLKENFAQPRSLLCVVTMSNTIKGLSESEIQYDGSALRIAIVHARWNKSVIDALVSGAVTKLKERGVKESNIVIQSVPGSYELPIACAK